MPELAKPSLHEFSVVCNEPRAEGVWRMVALSPTLAAQLRPGQFMNLAVPGDGSHILRVPLSFKRADAAAGTIELIYAVVGEGTERLSRMAAGASSTMVGPAGRGWWPPPGDAGRSLLVAGGVGLPPILAAAGMLAEAGLGFDAVVGAQSAGHHLTEELDLLRGMPATGRCDCARRVRVTTDDGSMGLHGFVTDAMRPLLEERPYAQVYACGPDAMMAAVARLARERGIACQVSLERMMGCGFGACSCCNVELAGGGQALCCQDGPVFDAEEVAW